MEGNTVTNTQNNNPGNSNEPAKTTNPADAKPGSQQTQGDSKPGSEKPEQQK
jgi:hypothetical protein